MGYSSVGILQIVLACAPFSHPGLHTVDGSGQHLVNPMIYGNPIHEPPVCCPELEPSGGELGS
jgi:hypothetical protein